MPMRLRASMPAWPEAAAWVNGTAPREVPAGKPTLVHFWSLGCGCCGEVLPAVNRWRDRYGDRGGLRIVGVHAPRSEAEKDAAAVEAAVRRYGLRHPVLVDNDLRLSEAFGNEWLPSWYLFDGKAELRHAQGGDRGLDLLERRIRKLLGIEGSESGGILQ